MKTTASASGTTKDGFDQKALQQARDILDASNKREAASKLAAVASSSTPRKPSHTNNNLISTSPHDVWAPTTSSRASVESVASSINPSSSVSNMPATYTPNMPYLAPPAPRPGPLIAPLLATPNMNPHNTFVPTNLGNASNTFVPTGPGYNAGYSQQGGIFLARMD